MIRIIFVGRSRDEWLKKQVDEYAKRLSRFTKTEILELKDEKITGNNNEAAKQKEGERILKLISDDFLIGLDSRGKEMESKAFAAELKRILPTHNRITFVTGGALGLSDTVLRRCDLILSLSKMTFTNQMVRLILAEQIYRAFMIIEGREYDK